ncbi:MAG: nucleotide exchange factor GrpE, partial [Chloroflexi bacterium]|nr:nucleotide exchange factor GrpE [Chloroflexota bacterium]
AEREAAELRRVLTEIEGQARFRVVRDLLPVVDALGESIRAARELVPAARRDRPTSHSLPTAAVAHRGERRAPPGLRIAADLPTILIRHVLGLQPRPADFAADHAEAAAASVDGLLLIERRLLTLPEREGVHPIPAVGEPFDPQRHRTVAVAEGAELPDGTVVSESLRGYTHGDRVLRYAEVVVARAPHPPSHNQCPTGDQEPEGQFREVR